MSSYRIPPELEVVGRREILHNWSDRFAHRSDWSKQDLAGVDRFDDLPHVLMYPSLFD